MQRTGGLWGMVAAKPGKRRGEKSEQKAVEGLQDRARIGRRYGQASTDGAQRFGVADAKGAVFAGIWSKNAP